MTEHRTADLDALPLRCWKQGGPGNEVWNWGDAISPLIYEFMTGVVPRIIDQPTFPCVPHLMMCGSTMKWINEWSIIWGTGEIASGMKPRKPNAQPLRVAAVRGPATRETLLARGIECPAVYGDPALLFPQVYEPAFTAEYELGIIPHYIDMDSSAVQAIARDDRVCIIDITQSGRSRQELSFIDDLARCKRIISSSLHGIIAADAYGIPALWVEFSNKVYGGGFKFADYFRSVKRPVTKPIDLKGGAASAAELIALIDRERYHIEIDLDPLCNAFPLL